jgi:aminopeptidase
VLSPLGVEVVPRDINWIKDQKMGSFLSVSQGSQVPPVFLEMTFNNSADKNSDPVVFVGK